MASVQLYEYDRPSLIGKHVEQVRLTYQSAKPVALCAAGRKPVSHALADVEARPSIDADQLHRETRICRNDAQMQCAMTGVLQQVRGQLRRGECHATSMCLIEAKLASHTLRNAPGMANLTFILDRNYYGRTTLEIQDHFRMLIRVPTP